MGIFLSSQNGQYAFNTIQLPTLPKVPTLNFNSAMLFLSSSLLTLNWGFTLHNYKDLPKSIFFKPFPKRSLGLSLNKKFTLGLPALGTWGLTQGLLLAANPHILSYPLDLHDGNREEVNGLMGNLVYFGLFLSQISLLQNNLRLIKPAEVSKRWFKYSYRGIAVAMLAGYGVFGYKLSESLYCY
jgi:hypothetical protein